MQPLEKFKERLSELMFYRGNMSSQKLSDAIKVNASTIRRWKSGKLNIKLSRALKLADFFECSLQFLFGRSEKMLDFVIYPALPFFEQLNKIMKKININRETLVRNLEKSHGHFYFWEKGVDPTMTIVCELADYLHCSLDELVGRER